MPSNENNMIKREIIAGNTLPITIVHMMGDVPEDLPEGYDLKVGFYRPHGSNILTYSLLNGSMDHVGTGVYQVILSHDVTKFFSGEVMMDSVIYNADKSVVKHASETIMLEVSHREMNKTFEL